MYYSDNNANFDLTSHWRGSELVVYYEEDSLSGELVPAMLDAGERWNGLVG